MSDSPERSRGLTQELADLRQTLHELQAIQSRLVLNFFELRETVASLKGQAVPLSEPLSSTLRGQCVITPFPREVRHA